MNRLNRTMSVLVLVVLVLTIAVSATGDGGYSTADDPLVSKSYVDALKAQIVEDLYARVDNDSLADYLTSTSFQFEAVSKGQKVIATGSCEMILRSGSGTVIITDPANIQYSIGFSDLTAACEVPNGTAATPNHLLLASAGDGRMIEVTSDVAYFMIRGEYTIVG